MPTLNMSCQYISFSADGNPFPLCPGGSRQGGNCTWWAWEQWHLLGYDLPPNWGNAAGWIVDAERTGLSVGKTPRVGSIAVFPRADGVWAFGPEGHVAFVTAVSNDGLSFNVTYQNYGDPTFMYIGTGFNASVINQPRFQNDMLRFIYFPRQIDTQRFAHLPGIISANPTTAVAQANQQFSQGYGSAAVTSTTFTNDRVAFGLSSPSPGQTFNVDFTGNGLSDLLLYNRQQGNFSIVKLNGDQLPLPSANSSSQAVNLGDSITPQGKWGSSLRIYIGNFSGMGESEILLYDHSAGTMQLLSLNPDLTIKKHVTIPGIGSDWEIYPGRFDGQRTSLFMYKRFAQPDRSSDTTARSGTPHSSSSSSSSPSSGKPDSSGRTGPRPTTVPSPTSHSPSSPTTKPVATTPSPTPTFMATATPTSTPTPHITPVSTPTSSPTAPSSTTPSPSATPVPISTVPSTVQPLTPSPSTTPIPSPQVSPTVQSSAMPSPSAAPTPPAILSPKATTPISTTPASDKETVHTTSLSPKASLSTAPATFGSSDLSGVTLQEWERKGRTANILLLDFDQNFNVRNRQQYTLWHASWEVYVGRFVNAQQDGIFLYDRSVGEGRLMDFDSSLLVNDYQQMHNLKGNWMVHSGDFANSGRAQMLLYDPSSGNMQILSFDSHLALSSQKSHANLGTHQVLYVGHFGMPTLSIMLYDRENAQSAFIGFDQSLEIAHQYLTKSWNQSRQILVGAFLDRSRCLERSNCSRGDDILVLDRKTGQIEQYIFSFGRQLRVYDNRAQAFIHRGLDTSEYINAVDTTTFKLVTTLSTTIRDEEVY